LNIKPCMGHISGTWELLLCEYWRKSMIIGEQNTDLKRLTGRLKLRFLTEIGRLHWNQGEEVTHFAWFSEPWCPRIRIIRIKHCFFRKLCMYKHRQLTHKLYLKSFINVKLLVLTEKLQHIYHANFLMSILVLYYIDAILNQFLRKLF
jgi:hypothetical protein